MRADGLEYKQVQEMLSTMTKAEKYYFLLECNDDLKLEIAENYDDEDVEEILWMLGDGSYG